MRTLTLCASLIYILLCLSVFAFLFSKERKRRYRVGKWGGKEVGRTWEEMRERNHDQNILYRKKYFQFKI